MAGDAKVTANTKGTGWPRSLQIQKGQAGQGHCKYKRDRMSKVTADAKELRQIRSQLMLKG